MEAIIIVDVQRAFPIPDDLIARIEVRSHAFPLRVFTQFVNPLDSLVRRKLRRGSCAPGLPETELRMTPGPADFVLEKPGYGLMAAQVERIRSARVTKALVCGADTDACVLGVLFSLFDAGIECEVERDLCWSSTGLHEAALQIVNEQFGTG